MSNLQVVLVYVYDVDLLQQNHLSLMRCCGTVCEVRYSKDHSTVDVESSKLFVFRLSSACLSQAPQAVPIRSVVYCNTRLYRIGN